MTLPFPYTFKLRYAGSSDVGYLCRPFGRNNGVPWAQQVYGSIPARLSAGAPELNDESNVTLTAWQKLESGGMGVREAADQSRYRYALGVYAGDADEWTLQPAALEITTALLPANTTIRQILPWMPPKSFTTSGPTNLVATATTGGKLTGGATSYYYQVSALTPSGESALSTEASAAIAAASGSVLLNWDTMPGATGYRIYGRPTAAATTKLKIAEVTGNTLKVKGGVTYRFNDTGILTPAGASPSAGPASVAALTRIFLVIACDATRTYLFQIAYDGSGKLTTTTLANLAVQNLATTVIASTTGVLGVCDYNAASIYGNRVWLPTAKDDGTTIARFLYYDSSKATPVQIRDTSDTGYTAVYAQRFYGDTERRLWYFQHNHAYWCSEPATANAQWTGPIPIGGQDCGVSSATIYGGTHVADSAMYLAKPDGLYRILDTETGPSTRGERVSDIGMYDTFNGVFLQEHRGQTFVAARHELFRYALMQIDSVSPNKDLGLPETLNGFAMAAATTGRHLYVLMSHIGNFLPDSTRHGYQQILESIQGDSWHQVHHSFATGSFSETNAAAGDRWTGRSMIMAGQAVTNTAASYLFFTGGDSCNRLFRLPVRLGSERLREAAAAVSAAPVATGSLFLPSYYGQKHYVKKAWHWVETQDSKLVAPNGATLSIAYLLETATFDPAGTFTATSPLASITSDATGPFYTPTTTASLRRYLAGNDATNEIATRQVSGNGIRLKLTLTPGSNNVAPVFGPIAVAYSEMNPTLERWVYNVELAWNQQLPDASTAQPNVSDVPTALASLISFAKNNGQIVLTDALGVEHNVRVDLGPITPMKWETGLDQIGTPFVEAQSLSVQVTCTENYLKSSY